MAEVILPSDSKKIVSVRGMKTKDEDLFLKVDLVRSGKVFSELIGRCCENLPSAPDDMLTGDRYALLIAIATETHGAHYGMKIDCQHCGTKQEIGIDISSLEIRRLADGIDAHAPFKVGPLPKCKKTIMCRRLTGRDEMNLMKIRQGNLGRGLATMALMLHIVDSDVDQKDATKKPIPQMFVEDLETGDSSFIRQACLDAECGVETTQTLNCQMCMRSFEVEIPVGNPDFFLRLPQRRNG